ncbi:PEP/pyruvate-binding domain-containing protein [Pontiella agarivorans]|uniref:PEP/pyruvate-binding domain-containing protein n=1 Tax=Pontiella agarivorans TaxID=3038953 RepID=A0ABU5MYN4_9BACT|nr:PEP/pyruvate-binding domain-containing protein [Pontiella agarivorans]MDZ8119300.1 PEP/pyruvate-binding domain-containing protein [Pontiella agarivorans]
MKDRSAFVLPLFQSTDVEQVGGKAVNLAKLMQAGLPVPDGFVITADAFRTSADGLVSSALADEIRTALAGLNGRRFAVRSSATAEDMAGASMAGQYDTFLNVQTAEEVIAAVEKCWSSVRSSRTEVYLSEYGIDLNEVAMAVVVQQQVSAEVAGVLFTVDPQNGSRENMLIEATWGLGEMLVSGEVQPDVICVSADADRVLSYDVAEKKYAIYPGGSGIEAVPEALRKQACLKFEQIARLRELGCRAEAHFGAPQDIEWAVEEGVVLMLQARPITTLAETDCYNRLLKETRDYLFQRLENGGGFWVRHNLGETLPHPTPLSWSLISHFMSGRGGFGTMHERLGFSPGAAVRNRSFLDRIGGEIYMDCSLMTEMFSDNYPFAYDPELLRRDPDAAQNPPTLPKGRLRAIGDAAKLARKAASKIETRTETLDREFDEDYVPKVLAWSEKQEALNLPEFGNEELIQLWREQTETVLDDFGAMAFLPSMVEAVAMEELRQILNEELWNEEPDEVISTLCVGTVPDRTMAGNLDLKRLDTETWIEQYGFRAPAEFDLASPRWRERPDEVVQLAAQLDDIDLEQVHRERTQAAEECMNRLHRELEPDVFNKIKTASDVVQRYLRFREDGKFYLMRAYSVLRLTALEFGRRLQLGDDIFFLQPTEIFQALETGFVPLDQVAKRKLEYAVEQRIQVPHVIEADDIPQFGTAPVRADGPTLDAHSVSSGLVEGSVEIVHSPEAGHHFPAGAVLVCPSTDPSWTPLFAKAGGLVLERGGALSHGAVVAREMGLPAVVLDGATELLEQGELITVDAQRGCIYRAGAEPIEHTDVPRSETPPPAGSKEAAANRMGLVAAILWGGLLALVFLLPPRLLHDPLFGILDALLWPLVRGAGMVGTVAVVAGVFGLLPILGQKLLTDNDRLFVAKRRSGRLRKAAAGLPADSERRKKMEALAAPVTTRILKASMVPLALILGPMILVFMWFPARVDPASWNASPGRMVSIVAEVDGECAEPVSLAVAEPLTLDSESVQTLPPIRAELEMIRVGWQQGSAMPELPWEVQAAGEQVRKTMLASLNAYLRNGVPPQKLTWLIQVPETAEGAFPVSLRIGDVAETEFNLVFGKSVPPEPSAWLEVSEQVVSVTVNYPRALQKASFFTLPGTKKDLGWLGVYLLIYLPVMFGSKFLLRVP